MTQEQLQEILDRIVASYAPAEIWLFGSRAKGCDQGKSDLDLLIVKDTSMPLGRRGKNVRAALTGVPFKIDLLFVTPEEVAADRFRSYTFLNAILSYARLVYSYGV